MDTEKKIDLQKYIPDGETSLVGRDNGLRYAERLVKDGILFASLENQFNKIVIDIPPFIVSMNKSFFLGIWAERVKELGETKFKEKYLFNTSEHIRQKILKGIQAALLDATQEDILNVGSNK